MKAYFAFMDKYYPEGDKQNTVNTYGYATAELLVHILQQCGDDLTRENIMKQAASLKNATGSLSLPGMVTNTSPTDYRINKQMQMMKFNGERWGTRPAPSSRMPDRPVSVSALWGRKPPASLMIPAAFPDFLCFVLSVPAAVCIILRLSQAVDLFEQPYLIPRNHPLSDVLHCNMPSATIAGSDDIRAAWTGPRHHQRQS